MPSSAKPTCSAPLSNSATPHNATMPCTPAAEAGASRGSATNCVTRVARVRFDERGERRAQLIGHLSGLDFGDSPHVRGPDPRSLRDQALTALLAYLQALAAKGGALPVLIVEDLHWADDSSLDLLQHLLAHSAELPLVLVMTGRPALLTRRPEWGTADTVVQLTPLAAAKAANWRRRSCSGWTRCQ